MSQRAGQSREDSGGGGGGGGGGIDRDALGGEGYHGVYPSRTAGRWISQLGHAKRRGPYIGTFSSEIEAAKAHDRVLLKLDGFVFISFRLSSPSICKHRIERLLWFLQ